MINETRRTRNLRRAAGLSDAGWATTFLTASRERHLPGFDVPAEGILLSEIDFLYRQSPESTRANMKGGAAKALSEFTARAYESTALRDLAAIVSITRASEAVPEIIGHVIGLHPLLSADDTVTFSLAVELIATLGTFPRNAQVADLFRKLLFDDALHFRFAGMLATAVVRADHRKFASAVTRFYYQRLRGPEFFHDRAIMAALWRATLPGDIATAVDKVLDRAVKDYVIHWGGQLNLWDDVFRHGRGTQGLPADSEAPIENYHSLKRIYGHVVREKGNVRKIYKQSRREGHG